MRIQKSKNNKKWLILVVILIVAAAGGVSYHVWTSKNDPKDTYQNDTSDEGAPTNGTDTTQSDNHNDVPTTNGSTPAQHEGQPPPDRTPAGSGSFDNEQFRIPEGEE